MHGHKFPTCLIGFICLAVLLALQLSCRTADSAAPDTNLRSDNLPSVILWAWERPENLEFVDPKQFGVAYLAQTLILRNDEMIFRPRRQPLKVSPDTKLIAVSRIETATNVSEPTALSQTQRTEIVERILKSVEMANVSGVQIDFDAAVSERDFYRELIVDVRRNLPANVSLSITAIASVCLGDRWFGDLPVAEAVPMIFRMGADDKKIKALLANGEDFPEPLCRTSYGVALDEIFAAKLDRARRLYVFNNRAWTPQDVARINQNFR